MEDKGPDIQELHLDALKKEIVDLREFVTLYRSVYMETQSHPTVTEENRVMMAARRLDGEQDD